MRLLIVLAAFLGLAAPMRHGDQAAAQDAPAVAPAASSNESEGQQEPSSSTGSPFFGPVEAPAPNFIAAGTQTASGFLSPAGLGLGRRMGFHFSIDQAARYSDNARSLSKGTTLPGRSRGDLYSVTTLSATYRRKLSLQEVFFEGSFGETLYRNNSDLDRRRFSFRSGIDWRAGHLCSGTFFGQAEQSEQEVASAAAGRINALQESQSVNFSGRCHIYGRIFGTFGASLRASKFEASPLSDSTTKSATIGLEYALPRLNTLGVRYTRSLVDFENGVARNATGLSSEVELNDVTVYFRRIISPKTSFTISGGFTEFSNNGLGATRRTTSPTYGISLDWRPTRKLAFRLSSDLRASPPSGVSSDYQTQYIHAVSATFRFSPKLTIVGVLSMTNSSNATLVPVLGRVDQKIETFAAALDANYRFSPFLTGGIGYRFSDRKDKVTGSRTTSNLFTARLNYQL